MDKLVPLLEQHSDKLPPTVVIEATIWLETVLAHVKLQEGGLGVHLPVNVCCSLYLLFCFSSSFVIANLKIDFVISIESSPRLASDTLYACA